MLLSLLRNFCSGVPVIHLLYVLKINSTPSTAALLHCLHRPVSFLWAPVASFYLHPCLSRMLAKAALGKALGLVPPPLPRQFCDFSRANPVTSNTSVFYLPGWLNRLEVTAGAKTPGSLEAKPCPGPRFPRTGSSHRALSAAASSPPTASPLFSSRLSGSRFPQSLRSDATAGGPGLRLGRCFAHLATLGGLPGGQGPASAAGRGVPGRWAATTRPLGAHLSRETVRRCQARATGSSSVRGAAGRWALATPRASLAPCLSGAHLPLCPSSRASLESPLPRPPPPQPASLGPAVGRLRCHSALPGRSHAARALGCERIKPARAEPPARACGLSGVFQRLLRPGALLQTGLGAPASRKVCGKWI